MSYNKLPADPTALILGIIGLVVVLPGCCCGFLTVISLILGIVGLFLASKSIKTYANDPENYHHKSWSNVKVAKIVCIITIVISALVLMLQIGMFAIAGEKFSEEFWRDLVKNGTIKYEKQDIDSTSTWDENVEIKLKKEGDSIYVDTIAANNTTSK